MNEPRLQPFRVEPYVRVKVWGGRRLPDAYGKDAPQGEPIGETWEVADLEEGESLVASGPLRDQPLSALVERYGEDLIGSEAPGEAFPLLVKVIDAADDLSVQVHPSERDVQEHFPDADSKDECWIVLDAEEHGSILHGVRQGVDREQFRAAVDEGRAAELLRRIDVRPGHVVRVPPGTIHAICEGVTLLEIQQPSDTTYRVYDYDRPGLDGEPRELHLDEAMRVANFGPQPPPELERKHAEFDGADVEVLVDVPAYRIERAKLRNSTSWRIDPTTPQILFVLEGSIELSDGRPDAESVEVDRAQTAVLPASSERVEVAPLRGPAVIVVAGLGGRPLLAN